MNGQPAIGARVRKTQGDYVFEGEVRAVFAKRSGALRVVVEDDRGLLLIMNEKQLDGITPAEAGPVVAEQTT